MQIFSLRSFGGFLLSEPLPDQRAAEAIVLYPLLADVKWEPDSGPQVLQPSTLFKALYPMTLLKIDPAAFKETNRKKEMCFN